ncbi:MAG: LPS assembly protein LptD [Opitutaceae bacterium]|nr:LPS assembly protein LptD [Opitutaceae bacterium]
MSRKLRASLHLLPAILIAASGTSALRAQANADAPAAATAQETPAAAARPQPFEVTADDPLIIDLKTGEGVLRKNARFVMPPWILTADEIRVNYKTNEAFASGHIVLMQPGLRVLAETAHYWDATREIEVTDFRFGRPPIHVEGRRAHGTAEVMQFEDVTLIYGEPNFLAPRATASRLTFYAKEERMEAHMLRAGFGVLPVVAMTGMARDIHFPKLEWESRAGLDSTLGLHVGASVYAPLQPAFRPGINLDLFSKRGVLVGPGLRYGTDRAPHFTSGATDFAWINDSGDPGQDSLGRPIEDDRYFWTWEHHTHAEDRQWSLNGVMGLWSDSAVVRDFRDDLFHRNQEPDTFVEGSLNGTSYILSAFARAQVNDFQLGVARLPEARFDLLPLALGQTGALLEMQASASALTEDTPGTNLSTETDRFDAYAAVSRTFSSPSTLSFTPVVGGRVTHYTRAENGRDTYTRGLGEVGFDSGFRAWSVKEFEKPVLGLTRVRHIVKPTLQYRYVPEADKGRDYIPDLDRAAFLTRLQPLGLGDRRDIDDLGEVDVVRLGLANTVEAQREDYGSTRLFELNFAADIHLDDSHDGDSTSDLQTELRVTPAGWFDTWLFLRNDLENLELNELNLRVMLVDSTVWSLGFDGNYLIDDIGQVRLFGRAALNEADEIYGRIVYDTRESRFNEIRIGLSRRVTQNWQLGLGAVWRDGQTRESDFGLKAEVRFLTF